jgi:hypothetical protein
MNHAMQIFVNMEQSNVSMDYHARATYAKNRMFPVKTLSLIASYQMIHATQTIVMNLLVVPYWKHELVSAIGMFLI